MEMTNLPVSQLKDVFNSLGNNPIKEQRFMSYVVAQTVAYNLALPLAPVECIKTFYENEHYDTVVKAVSDANEQTPMAFDFVKATIFWAYVRRYNTVFVPASSEAMDLLVDTIKYKLIDAGVGDGTDVPCEEACTALTTAVKLTMTALQPEPNAE